jgi:vacuolar protein sorting-associated protein 13A/C
MEVAEPGSEPLQLTSSVGGSKGPSSGGKDLLRVDYTRVQNNSPEYLSHYEGCDQIISMDVSTVIFRAAPEPLLTLYDLLMTTFVPSSPSAEDAPYLAQDSSAVAQLTPESSSPTGKLRLLVKLACVEGRNPSHFVRDERTNLFQSHLLMREPALQRYHYRPRTPQFYLAIQ